MAEISINQIMDDIHRKAREKGFSEGTLVFSEIEYWKNVLAPLANRRELVIYGIGNVGRILFPVLYRHANIVAICDNGYPEKDISGIPVYNHNSCVRKFSGATYIVTPQKGFLKIVAALHNSGITSDRILFFDSKKRCLEGDVAVSIKTDPSFSNFAGRQNVVLYGIGNVGKKIFERLSAYRDFKFLAICDNSYGLGFYKGVPVHIHDECMRMHKNAFFLVTPQSGYVKIVLNLLDAGVPASNILFFDNVKKSVETMV